MSRYFDKLCEKIGKGLVSDYKPITKEVYHFKHYDLIIEPKLENRRLE